MAELIPGIEFDFGAGRRYSVPPLTLGALQRLQGALEKLSTANILEADSIATVIDATHAALRRNYPELTLDAVADLVDVGNMFDIMAAVMDVSGFKRKALEEQAKNP